MALKIKIPNLEGLEEHFHSLYTQQSDGSYLLTGVEGMKTQTDLDVLTTSLAKERKDHKATKDKYAVLGDKDPVDILSQLDRVSELEAAASGKIDETRINEMVEGRLRTKLAPVERERDQLKTQLEAAQTQVNDFSAREKRRTIHDKVREAAIASKMMPEAYDDVLMYADAMMDLTEDGRVVTKDQVGVTPGLDPTVWLTEMQQKKRYWWPGSQSGNSFGSEGVGNLGGENPWSATGWNLTKQAEVHSQDPKRADQMARSAGTTVGGPKPQPKAA
ncbi:hypothetical protein [Nitrosomonas ureae]|uniref:Phage minor structural protein GP20 n=1 Tax=Nitrosomonas ureae TaxID=44577 RepID=A0A1H2ENS1_9PROT|nr:hypothetical protein [Nitrosomonas ureae]ALQ51902.1 hypothetical protein ATY38_12140 [Nitrosomonas ureae]SDT96832.1 hypothetical protein SAMN05216406_11442 [Nitrosomonas ureae]